jgi:hypothetical protein
MPQQQQTALVVQVQSILVAVAVLVHIQVTTALVAQADQELLLLAIQALHKKHLVEL